MVYSNKLRTYNKLKRDFGVEMYLQGIPDYRIRKNLTKIMTSTYSFEIEMWRYKEKSGKYTPASDRLCKFCKRYLVDEQHVVMVCDNYNDSQKEMFERVSLIFPDFNIKNEKEIFIYIMSTKDVELINITSKYLQDVNKLRGKI